MGVLGLLAQFFLKNRAREKLLQILLQILVAVRIEIQRSINRIVDKDNLIHCALCKTHMVGVSTRKKDKKFPYYLCNKRWRTHDCDQAYGRADLLEDGPGSKRGNTFGEQG
jgi:hypothetical protein